MLGNGCTHLVRRAGYHRAVKHCLLELGLTAKSYLADQICFRTDSAHGRARIEEIEVEKLRQDIDQGVIPVVAGFQGVNDQGDITTLGRGGSDTSAVALAAALGADECEICTDVEGVYTTDPRIVEGARRLGQITFEEMLELASLGSKSYILGPLNLPADIGCR